MSIGSNDSSAALLTTSTLYKKRHPQLLKLVPARAQSCADFSSRLQLLPSSMAAAALSAKQIRDSGSSPQFIPFSPNNNNNSTTKIINIRPMSNSTPSATTTTGYNSSPSLSPQRKVSRSARLCHSFRRTLRRNSPGGKKALAQTDSNASAPTALLSSLGEQQQLLNSDVNKGSQNSVLNAVMNGRTSSFSQLQQKESRLASSEVSKKDDSVEQTPEKKQQQKQQADDNRRNSSSSPLSHLMNDWEIGGTQNPWVCPSDRHLQLRAQLKSGWSVRTATARSPTTSKQSLLSAGGITEAEQEKIRKVLARAEQGRMNEQIRIGKMVERLDRLRSRAVGNGVTQCLLCQTEFGLLAAKSYAAMCSDCRKYVCQRNCGVETFDQKRKEPIFLCKICSEYREVMWKKSGAWFYKEVPSLPPSRPCSAMADISSSPMLGSVVSNNCQQQQTSSFMTPTSSIGQPDSPTARSLCSTGPTSRRHFPFGGGQDYRKGSKQQQSPITCTAIRRTATSVGTAEPVPIPSEHQQRLKTNPRPRIIPSWVHDGLQQSSISVDEESDGESASSSTSSSLEPAQFRMSLGAQKERAMAVKQRASINSNNSSLNNQQKLSITSQRNLTTATIKYGRNNNRSIIENNKNMQRVVLRRGGRNRVLDSDSEDQEALSRRSSPSISPRHSLATPSSYGGDDLPLMLSSNAGVTATAMTTQNYINSSSLPQHNNNDEKTMSDSRSVDSGVVQSDHSAQQHGLAAFAASVSSNPPPIHQQQMFSPNFSEEPNINNSWQQQQQLPPPGAKSPSPIPPPIPPRSATIAAPPPIMSHQIIGSSTSSFKPITTKRPSSANNYAINQTTNEMGFSSLSLAPDSSITTSRRSTQSSTVQTIDNNMRCREDAHLVVDGGMSSGRRSDGDSFDRDDSPAFMSEPEDDISTLGSIQLNLLYLSEEKQLIIHLIRAKNLKAMDKNGFSDPYVKFHLLPGNAKATKLTSKTIEKTLNPEWNQELIYYGITEEERLRKSLRVTVLDRDRIGADFLGETRIALRKLPLGVTKKFNLYLEHAMPTPLEKPIQEERGKLLLSVCYNIQQGSLFVTIKRCVELLGMDATGFSDPYCKVSLIPLASKAHRQKTAIKKRTLNPEFNETMQFLVPFKDLPKKTLDIGVYDYDMGRHDDYIGGVVLSTAATGERGRQWQQIIENPGKTLEYWHKLETDG